MNVCWFQLSYFYFPVIYDINDKWVLYSSQREIQITHVALPNRGTLLLCFYIIVQYQWHQWQTLSLLSVFVHFLIPQMTFASDKLYKGYLRRNMPTIVSKVKVREIIPHLPCLTDHDRVGFFSYKDKNMRIWIRSGDKVNKGSYY